MSFWARLKSIFSKETTMQLTVNGATTLAVGATVVLSTSEAAIFSVSDPSILSLSTDTAVTSVSVTALAVGSATVHAVSTTDPSGSAGVDLDVVAVPTQVVAAPTSQASAPETAVSAVAKQREYTAGTDALLAKLKSALVFAGHDVEEVWDEALALAKKLV